MSSDDDHDDIGAHIADERNKKRRVQRACDNCRKKKIRCDGSQMPDNRCSNCITWNHECTYVEAAKKRGPPKGYVESLENRLEKMEKLLRSLCPDADFTKELGTFIDRETWYHERSKNPTSGFNISNVARRDMPQAGSSRIASTSKQTIEADDDLSDTEFTGITLAEGLKELRVAGGNPRFLGKSSGITLVQAAMDFKREYSGSTGGPDVLGTTISDRRREEFWLIPGWESVAIEEHSGPFEFPPEDLFRSLVDLFFQHVNPFTPLLHRPTFERQYAEGKHHTDRAFASTVLLLCACASRWSNDPRCLVHGVNKHSAGWAWFERAQSFRRNALMTPSLHDLQVYALAAIFLAGTTAGHASWTMIGIGLRLAQDVGVHRRKTHIAETAIEDELWKRAFWILVALDRTTSAVLGRPCAVQDEDFDLDHPLEVDDEYWENEDPALAFKQPAGRPSQVSYYNCFLKLNQILAFALRTVYSINKSKILLGFVGPQWEQHIVAELDSALNRWIDSVPDHLRWDPNREDPLFFAQSVTLYATYYHLQILIHRPFIPSPRKPSPLSFPSLAICTNAARSCSHVLEIMRRRYKNSHPYNMFAAFTSGIVLLLNIWGAKKSGMPSDPVKQMSDVHKCMQHLQDLEPRFRSAGRFWDILYELASVGELPLPQSSSGTHGSKRQRDSDQPIDSSTTNSTPESAPSKGSRVVRKLPASAQQNPNNGHVASNTQQRLQQTPTPPQNHPKPTGQLSIPISYPAPMNVVSNATGFHQPMEWDKYMQATPGVPDPGFAQQIGPHQGQQYPGYPQGYMYPSNPGIPSIGYEGYGGHPPQDVPLQHGHGIVVSNPGVDIGNIWETAPSSFEYDDWGHWVANDPGMMSGMNNMNPQQGQQHPNPHQYQR